MRRCGGIESGETFASESLRRGLLIRCHAPKDRHSSISGLLLGPPAQYANTWSAAGIQKKALLVKITRKGAVGVRDRLTRGPNQPGARCRKGGAKGQGTYRAPLGANGIILKHPSFCPRNFLCVCLPKGIVSRPFPRDKKKQFKNISCTGRLSSPPIVASYQPLFRNCNGVKLFEVSHEATMSAPHPRSARWLTALGRRAREFSLGIRWTGAAPTTASATLFVPFRSVSTPFSSPR